MSDTSINNPELGLFRTAAQNGQLLLGMCVDTGQAFFYPRRYSPFTGGETETLKASGLGTIYTYSVLERTKSPYCLAYIKLEEGPIILSNILPHAAHGFQRLAIDTPVSVVFHPDETGQIAPFFEPKT